MHFYSWIISIAFYDQIYFITFEEVILTVWKSESYSNVYFVLKKTPKTLKMVLDTYLLNTQRNPGKVVAIEKGALWSLLTTVTNFTLLYLHLLYNVCLSSTLLILNLTFYLLIYVLEITSHTIKNYVLSRRNSIL